MHDRRDLDAVPAPVLTDLRVPVQHRLQPRTDIPALIPQGGELAEMVGDVPVVPGHQDRFDEGARATQREDPRPGGKRPWPLLRPPHRRPHGLVPRYATVLAGLRVSYAARQRWAVAS